MDAMHRFSSDLDLNGDIPVRVQPGIGEWGTARVPSTRDKYRARQQVVWVTLSVTAALLWLGWTFYKVLNGG